MLIALADVGPGVQLEEQLNKAGAKATWAQNQADGPIGAFTCEVVILDGDHLGGRLAAVAEKWRDHPSVPGVVAIGSSAAARDQAPRARVALVAPTAKLTTLAAAIQEAAKHRLATGMRWAILRAATKLPPTPESPEQWQLTLVAARKVDIEIPRTTLRWHANHYATPTDKVEQMREQRMLSPSEMKIVAKLDGTQTVQTLVAKGPVEPAEMARFLWTLGSMSALDFTPEVRDVATPARRALHDMRAHLRARAARLERSTYYDVLEITPLSEYEEIEQAYQLVASRYAPKVLAQFDLCDLAELVQPMWELVEKSRSVLVDHAARGRYHDWLRTKLKDLRTIWAVDPGAVSAASTAFTRGQLALGAGDVHKAMSELAFACRQFPGHPEYEANLSWARYRVQVASGRDRVEAAVTERKIVEELLVGCKPWPRALVALALLCAAAGDADSARWHLHTALLADPMLPAAQQLAQRLGMRR